MRTRAAAEALVGTILAGRYRVLSLLASGGTGHIYAAETDASAPRVAIKVLRAEHRGNATMLARFEREARVAARVRHPHVLAVHELEELPDGGRLFAMELLTGLDLADTLAYARALRPERAARIARELAEALGAAHAAGVVHRDVKPENVFLVHAPDGREIVKLLDFGLAWIAGDPGEAEQLRITARGGVVGTPEYMAPEQAHGAPVRPSADIYSLGVVLYEMLAGRVPFIGDSYPAIAYQHTHAAPPPLAELNPSLRASPELVAIVRHALAKAPADRVASMAELAAALRATPEGRSGPAPGSRRNELE